MQQSGAIINEIIAVDNFHKNCVAKYYFITHAHADHCTSLDHKWKKGKIYCSTITAQVLPIVTKRPRSKPTGVNSKYIQPLKLNIWHEMDGFSVMLLDANHIPGSVMFLFEGALFPEGRVLFTGDFRADAQFYHNIFAMSVLQEKNLDVIYLDNTYISAMHHEFPNRKTALKEVINLIRHLLYDGANPIAIVVPKIGREQLLTDIALYFKCKIWVDSVRYEIAEILGLSEYFTTVQEETYISTCTRRNIRSVLSDAYSQVIDASMVMDINPDLVINDPRMHYVGYSDHCSPNELRDFLSQLSFSRVIGLSSPLSVAVIDDLVQLSLMDNTNTLIKDETSSDRTVFEDDSTMLISSAVLSRIGLIYDYALRSAFAVKLPHGAIIDVEMEPSSHNAIEAQIQMNEGNGHISMAPQTKEKYISDKNENNISLVEATVKANETSRKIDSGSTARVQVWEAIEVEDFTISDFPIKEVIEGISVENLAVDIIKRTNDEANIKGDRLLSKFLSESDFLKLLENLDDVCEEYREAVNSVAEKLTVQDMDLPYFAEEHVFYEPSNASAIMNMPSDWFDESCLSSGS